jgi:hypothetical protein
VGRKTVLHCERDEEAVVEFLRSDQRALLIPYSADRASVAKAA